jgi:SHS2 domain-containing protein
MKQFEILDISGDAGIRVFGNSLEDIFCNSAVAMFSLITDLSAINVRRKVEIKTESHSVEGLLVSWLNELIFHFDTYGFVGKRIIISELNLPDSSHSDKDLFSLKAVVEGEDFDPEKHDQGLLIKAATYHNLRIEKNVDLWEADIIFDV